MKYNMSEHNGECEEHVDKKLVTSKKHLSKFLYIID